MAWTLPPRKTSKGGKRYTGMFRDGAGRQRSAGTFASADAALKAAQAAEAAVAAGTWIDPTDGNVTFEQYVDGRWLPLMELDTEISTLAAYRSNLRAHFLPAFGQRRMRDVTAAVVQDWVRTTVAKGRLSAASISKYHTVLHGLFRQAVADKVIGVNPCAGTKLPKVPSARARAARRTVISPAQFEAFVAALPPRWVDLAETDIETGARWGELIALRPRALDELGCAIVISQVIVEVSKADSPTGERFVIKDLPKDDEPRTLAVSRHLMDRLTDRARRHELGPDDLLFATGLGTPLSRSSFRQRVIAPAMGAAGLTGVTLRDLRHAHASWALAGGATMVEVRDRLGHATISTTELYLHALAGAQTGALSAFGRVRASGQVPRLPAA